MSVSPLKNNLRIGIRKKGNKEKKMNLPSRKARLVLWTSYPSALLAIAASVFDQPCQSAQWLYLKQKQLMTKENLSKGKAHRREKDVSLCGLRNHLRFWRWRRLCLTSHVSLFYDLYREAETIDDERKSQ